MISRSVGKKKFGSGVYAGHTHDWWFGVFVDSTPIKSDRCHSLLFSIFIYLCWNNGCRKSGCIPLVLTVTTRIIAWRIGVSKNNFDVYDLFDFYRASVCCLYGWGYLNAGWCDRREILAQGRANTMNGNEVVWGLAAPGRRKKGQMKFSLLWESVGNFCILSDISATLARIHTKYMAKKALSLPYPTVACVWTLRSRGSMGWAKNEWRKTCFLDFAYSTSASYRSCFFSASWSAVEYVGHRPAHILA